MFVLVDFSKKDIEKAVETFLKKWADERKDVVDLHYTSDSLQDIMDACEKACC
jgi:hypothetical protein